MISITEAQDSAVRRAGLAKTGPRITGLPTPERGGHVAQIHPSATIGQRL